MGRLNRFSNVWNPKLPPLPLGWARKAERPPRLPADLNQCELPLEGPPPKRLSIVDKLRSLLEELDLSQADFARWVLGADPRTVQRYLAGDKIPEARANWIRRLEQVSLEGDMVVILVRRGAVGPQWENNRRLRRLRRLARGRA